MGDFLEKLRFKLLERLIRLFWWCENYLDNAAHHRQHKPIFFTGLEPWIISLIIAGASFGANMAISAFLAPKPKQQVKGKLTGEITLTDSIYGAPIHRIYGGRPADNSPGGVEVGCNIVYMTEIRKITTPSPGGDGGGGKGGPSPQPNLTINYKVDLAGVVGAGKLRLLRMKWNEDTVYSVIGGIGGGNTSQRIEAEDPANDLAGGANIVADLDCSNDEKVTDIGNGGTLTFNVTNILSVIPIEPGEPALPYLNFAISYKSAGDTFAYVKLNGNGGIYLFPDTAGLVGVKYILRPATFSDYTLEFSNPDAAAPEIDCIDITLEYLEDPGPTGLRNETFPPETAQDNLLLPDPYAEDTQAFERYDLATPVAVDGVIEVPVQGGASLAWYEGTNNQPVDTVIDASVTALYGANLTSAFRDSAYFRIQNMDITEYGSVPAIRVVVENIDLQTVEEILLFEGTHGGAAGGLDSADLDLSAASAMHCRGYAIADAEAPAKAFEDLGLVHNLTHAENSDGQIVAIDLNDRTVVATLTEDDLGAYIANESDEVPLDDVISTIPEESEDLIRVMELQFNNPLLPSDFSTDRRSYNYPFTDSQRKETRSVNMTLLPEEAGAIVRRELQKHHLQQAPDTIVTSHKYAWVDAGNCIEIPIEGENHVRRVQEKTGSAPGVYEMTLVDEDIYILADDGVLVEEIVTSEKQKPIKSSTRYPANTVGTIIDTPSLMDKHRGLTGVYVAACSRGRGDWKGCQVQREKADGYSSLAALTKQASMGIVVTEFAGLAEVDREEGFFDPGAVLTVDFYGDFNPSTVTTPEAEDGANAYLIGQEVAVVTDWTRDLDYPNRWVGTSIYRGLKDTIDRTEMHSAGERVVLLNDAVKFIALDDTEVNVARNWKFVTYGGHIDDTAEIAFTFLPRTSFMAGEALVSPCLVNLYDVSGVLKVRYADSTDDTKPAHGFILVDTTSGEYVRVHFSGDVMTGLEGLTPGDRLYLSETPGAVTDTCPAEGSGKLRQSVGTALSDRTLIFEPEHPIKLT